MGRETCVITGVGPGTAAALARRFAEGYRVAMLARDAERLAECWPIAHPPRSAWTFDVQIRPDREHW